MADIETAHILFPSDAPSAPDPSMNALAFARDDAAMRLMRRAEPAETAPADDAAASPSQTDDAAAKLFNNDAKTNYGEVIGRELEDRRIAAHVDGDADRVAAIENAKVALSENFKAAGTDAADIKEAFDIVRHSAGMVPWTQDQHEKSFSDGLVAVKAENISDADLTAARAMIADMEKVSPGVRASLFAFGAGNDIRMIRKAVAEARRRGY